MDFIIPLDDWINIAFDKINYYISPILRAASVYLEAFIKKFEDVLMWPLPIIVMVIVGALIWVLSNRNLWITSFVGFFLAFAIGVWESSMDTVSFSLSGVFISIFFAV